jgi:hypothetical protein
MPKHTRLLRGVDTPVDNMDVGALGAMSQEAFNEDKRAYIDELAERLCRLINHGLSREECARQNYTPRMPL